MKKVKKLLAAVLVVLTVLSVSALSASATTSVPISKRSLASYVAWQMYSNEPYFKVWMYNGGNSSISLNFVSGLRVSKTTMTNSAGNQKLYFRDTYGQTMAVGFSATGIGSGSSAQYSVRRATTLNELGTW